MGPGLPAYESDDPALRDVLLAAVRASGESVEARRDRLREVAGLCESNLRDTEGAIAAWKLLLTLDHGDEAARLSLTRTLERLQRWDDLASLYEQEENTEVDLEKKLALQKKLAIIHETKRKDLAATADTWERIANLTPEDDQAIATAAKMFTKIRALDRAVWKSSRPMRPASPIACLDRRSSSDSASSTKSSTTPGRAGGRIRGGRRSGSEENGKQWEAGGGAVASWPPSAGIARATPRFGALSWSVRRRTRPAILRAAPTTSGAGRTKRELSRTSFKRPSSIQPMKRTPSS